MEKIKKIFCKVRADFKYIKTCIKNGEFPEKLRTADITTV